MERIDIICEINLSRINRTFALMKYKLIFIYDPIFFNLQIRVIIFSFLLPPKETAYELYIYMCV